MKKKLGLFFALIFIFQFAVTLTACGKANPESIVVESTNNKYSIVNNTITVEWGDIVSLKSTDFVVTINYDNNKSETIAASDVEKNGYTFSTDLPVDTVTPVGQYTITFTYKEVTTTITVNIVQKIVELNNIQWSDSQFVYDGTEKQVVIVSELPSYVTVTYTDNKKTDAGTYQANAHFESTDSNYALSVQSDVHQWSIGKATLTNEKLNAVALTSNELVYNGTIRQVTVNNDTLPQGFSYTVVSGDKGTNVGSYYLVIKLTSLTSNYNDAELTLTWNITKANVNIDDIKLVKSQFVYDGQAKTVEVVADLPEGVTYEIISGQSGIDVDDYSVTIKVNVTDNYNPVDNIVLNWQITNPPATYIVEPTIITDITYDGTAHPLVTNGECEGGEINYRIVYYNDIEDGYDAQFAPTVPTAVNAGRYVIAYKIVSDANHSDVAEKYLTVVINKAQIDVSNVTLNQTEYTYNGEEISVEVDINTLPENVQASIVSGGVGKDVNTYKAVILFTYDAVNYQISQELAIDWSITKATLYVTASIDNEVIIGDTINPSYTVDGLLGNDTIDVIKGTPVYDYGNYNPDTANEGEICTVTLSGLYADNYNIIYSSANFVTARASVKLTRLDGTNKYFKTMPEVITLSGTYTLLQNVNATDIVIDGQSLEVTLDLAEFNITFVGEADCMIKFSDESTGSVLTIKNGVIAGGNCTDIIVVNGANTVNLEETLTITASKNAVEVKSNSTLNTKATISINGDENYYAIYVAGNATKTTLNVIGGNIVTSYTAIFTANNGIVNIKDGNIQAETVIEARLCNISVSGGVLSGYIVANDNQKFITGGYFTHDFSEDGYVADYYEVIYNGEYYIVNKKAEITSIYAYFDIFNINHDNFENFYISTYDENGMYDDKTIREFGDTLTIEGIEDIYTPGTHTLKFIYHNESGKDVSTTIDITSVAIVAIEPASDYVKDFTSKYSFEVLIKYSDGTKINSLLYEVLPEDSEFDDTAVEIGEIYNLDVQYAGFKTTMKIEIKDIYVEYIKFAELRQYLNKNYNNKVNNGVYVKYNYSANEQYFGLTDNVFNVISITDSYGNTYDSTDDITEQGIYTVIVKVGLATTKYGTYSSYTDEMTMTFEVVGGEDVSYINVNTTDILAGEKPLFDVSHFNGEYNSGADIFDEIVYNSEDFDYNKAGKYTFTVTYQGYTTTVTINVHNAKDVKYAYLDESTYIIDVTKVIKLRVNTWDDEYETVIIGEENIIGDIDFTTEGEYYVDIEYNGYKFNTTIRVVSGNKIRTVYVKDYKSDFPLNTTDIIIVAEYYNETKEEFTLTQDMIDENFEFNTSVVGGYGVNFTYKDYRGYVYINIYDPEDTTIKNM